MSRKRTVMMESLIACPSLRTMSDAAQVDSFWTGSIADGIRAGLAG
ncbi:MAG: hypothetical protein JSV19_02290 [Phycisphaerales bacterium]|nr:MAG: hypothetical protein JSV19_02290 [Phycisphaerales bacterium]